MNKAPHLKVGKQGEDFVVSELKKKKWKILEQNWRPNNKKSGIEIDIIAFDGSYIVILEVKTRVNSGSNKLSVPIYTAFSLKKQKSIIEAAKTYLSENNSWEKPCRFDLACVSIDKEKNISWEHYANVIEIGDVMGNSNASWQPW